MRPRTLWLTLLFACEPPPSDLPEAVCRPPAAPPEDWYVDVTDQVGLGQDAEVPPVATSLVAGDIDGDGWVDLFASVFPSQREPDPAARTRFLFLNRPHPDDPNERVFVDVLPASGLLATRDGVGGRGITTVSWGDLDNDGDLDAIGCPAEISTAFLDGCAAFLNDGDGFFVLADGGDLEDDLFSVPSSVLLDFDRDGVLDFWPGTIGLWQYGPANTSAARLYQGEGDGTFRDVSVDAGLPTDTHTDDDYRANFGVTSCDFDLDGDRDVVIANYGVPVGPNRVYRNDEGQFVEVASELGVDAAEIGGFTYSITCGDLDADGDNDLMTAEVAHPGQGTDTSTVLVGPNFRRLDNDAVGLARAPGEMEGDNLAHFEDIDLDGMSDILVLSSNYPQQSEADDEWTHASLFQQSSPRKFEDVTSKTPFGRAKHQSLEGSALFDYDHDGDLDLVTGTGLFNSTWIGDNLGITTAAIHVYRNMVGQDSNWSRVRVIGAGEGSSNRSGIGAVVTVTTGGGVQQREVLGSWGHSNTQSDTSVTFGLGEFCTIDQLEVRWPDAEGTVTVYEDVLANYPIEVIEGEQAVRYVTD